MKKFVALVLSLVLVTGICAVAFGASAVKPKAKDAAADAKAKIAAAAAKKAEKPDAESGAIDEHAIAEFFAAIEKDEKFAEALESFLKALEENSEKLLGEREIKKGNFGIDVFELQILLHVLGYRLGDFGFFKDGIDGEYGDETAAAVKALQKALKIKESGNYDASTHKALVDKIEKTGLVFKAEKGAAAAKVKNAKK